MNKNRKMNKKGNTARVLVSAMALSLSFTTLMPVVAYGAEANTPKEEVVYANLNADGSVDKVNVVNIFDLKSEGKIIDYGNYENVRNMTTKDAINMKAAWFPLIQNPAGFTMREN